MRTFGIALICAFLATGCGARESTNGDIGESAKRSAEQGSSRITFTFGGGEDSVTGAFDYERGTAVVDADFGRMIFTEDADYVELGADERKSLPGAKRWIASPREEGSRDFFPPFAHGPQELLRFLQAASDAQEVGTGSERGVDVTRYDARLEVDAALAQLESEDRDSVRTLIQQYWPDARTEGVPLRLAVDGEGLLRRVDVRIPGEEELFVEFYDYGIDVRAVAPPAEDVMTFEQYMKAMQNHCRIDRGDEDEQEDVGDAIACMRFRGEDSE